MAGKTIRQMAWYARAVGFGLVAQLLISNISYAESVTPYRWKFPKARNYEAAAMGEDCSIYRAMRKKAARQIEYARGMENKYANLLVQNRLALESCAKQNGIEEFEDEREEVLVAELCGAFYQAWLQPAARLELLAADLKEAEQTKSLMEQRLQSYCGHIASDDDLQSSAQSLEEFEARLATY